jgi:hypothetical protein
MFLRKAGFALTLAVGIACSALAIAQTTWQPGPRGIGFGQPKSNQWVQMISSPDLAVNSAKRQGVALQFSIDNGLHINSHTPHSQFLIPTALTLDKTPGVEIAQVEYPQGIDYHFQFSPKDALSVYTGQFGVLVRLHAHPGHYVLHGQLRYQACDNRACNPPQTLPLKLDLTAK